MKALYKRATIGHGRLVHFVVMDYSNGETKLHHALCNCDYATTGQGWPCPAHLVDDGEQVDCLRCLVMINTNGRTDYVD